MQDEVVHVPQVTYPSRPVLIEPTSTEAASSPESSEAAALVSDPQQITRALLTFRLSIARSERVPAYRVMTNDMLYAIVRERPMELVELARIRGMGPKRLQAYGEQILAIVQGQHAFVPLEASQLPLSTHT
jgi:ribonuclease D